MPTPPAPRAGISGTAWFGKRSIEHKNEVTNACHTTYAK